MRVSRTHTFCSCTGHTALMHCDGIHCCKVDLRRASGLIHLAPMSNQAGANADEAAAPPEDAGQESPRQDGSRSGNSEPAAQPDKLKRKPGDPVPSGQRRRQVQKKISTIMQKVMQLSCSQATCMTSTRARTLPDMFYCSKHGWAIMIECCHNCCAAKGALQ